MQSTADSSGDAVYTCTICLFSSGMKNGVKAHIRSHSTTKLFLLFRYDQKKAQQSIVKRLTERTSAGMSVCMSV